MREGEPSFGYRKGALPVWDESMMRNRTRRWLMAIGALYVTIWLALMFWIFALAPIQMVARPPSAGPDLNLVLAPVLVLAALNELIVARVFDLVEGSWRTIVAYLGYGMRRLRAAEQEVAVMRQILQNTSVVYFNVLAAYSEKMRQQMAGAMSASTTIESTPIPIPDAMNQLQEEAGGRTAVVLAKMQEAEARVNEAESKLESFTDAISYQRAKRLWVAMLGLILGVVWASLGSLQLFSSLGVEVPARLDVMLTGLIIGSIQSPVHSIVGSIQEMKDAVVSRVSSAKPSNSGEDSK